MSSDHSTALLVRQIKGQILKQGKQMGKKRLFADSGLPAKKTARRRKAAHSEQLHLAIMKWTGRDPQKTNEPMLVTIDLPMKF